MLLKINPLLHTVIPSTDGHARFTSPQWHLSERVWHSYSALEGATIRGVYWATWVLLVGGGHDRTNIQTTPRIRVWSDKIPRVLLFICFCRGLSGNKEERPTCWDYIEILTHRAIFYHLEDSRSHGNEREGDRARGQGARPPPRALALVSPPMRANFADDAPPT